ncbi:MAG TPA: alpha-glucosidase [Spirochaetia bacterium]|nr:alpha-glucosidase [Spirochaetia bacterium]
MDKRAEDRGGVVVDEIADGFSIAFRGRVVLRHSSANAAFSFGSGRGSFRMSHGNFKVSDRLARRIPCSGHRIEREGDSTVISFPDPGLQVEVTEAGGRLSLRFTANDSSLNRLWVRLEGSTSEHIYGCGEQYSRLDLKGSRVPLWVSEQGVGRGANLVTLAANLHSDAGGAWYTTYYPVPAFVSSDNWYCVCETTAWARFDFRHHTETWMEFWQIPLRMTLGVETTAGDTLGSLTQLLGRQPSPPEWIFDGLWLGVQGGRDRVEAKLKDAIDAGVKIGALWAQDWEGKRETSFGRQLMWDWQFDPATYPDLPGYIKELRGRGVRFLGYINPFLAVEGKLYQEASAQGLCIKDRSGKDYLVTVTTFPAALLDLTNPAARSWIKEVIKRNMVDIGLSGWMADYGEYLPTDAVLHSGESAELVHNRYPALWARVNREAVDESGKSGEVLFFMRSGYLDSTKYSTSFWAGDQMVDWSRHDGLPSVIPAGLSLGFIGAGVWHTEIGGFTSLFGVKRTEELFMRWAELACFTPIMRTHEGNRPDTNWQFNSSPATLSHLARMTRIFSSLKPYHLAAFDEYRELGLPPIRHPYLHYEEDARLHSYQDQYLYGRDLFVAPTIAKGSKRRDLYLPDDRWIHLWSGRKLGGGRVTVAAPIGQPAVFFREASPFRSLFEEIAEQHVVDNPSKVK